ncbi:hypothetical protein SAMN05192574_101835 [Mucilaginibacter gossypiicola]|uniref:Uncharacterized protein n=1 Tax=Mucilaginibacter gossypiicola TaxID=551995 RepID=A0A1H8BAK1_9SPHI|nr:hypothetical protein [Mucilaginibacter gossypiicola]SEM79469.1 hypothetical protein SAMN05192574_101835 [Mucilaginibacter gossypiicola]
MKKLKLKMEGISEMLTKDQMKKISGGYSGACGSYCDTGAQCTTPDRCFNYCYGGGGLFYQGVCTFR